jgi:hypothetical protein
MEIRCISHGANPRNVSGDARYSTKPAVRNRPDIRAAAAERP